MQSYNKKITIHQHTHITALPDPNPSFPTPIGNPPKKTTSPTPSVIPDTDRESPKNNIPTPIVIPDTNPSSPTPIGDPPNNITINILEQLASTKYAHKASLPHHQPQQKKEQSPARPTKIPRARFVTQIWLMVDAYSMNILEQLASTKYAHKAS